MFSDYYYTLDAESAVRYREKIAVIGVDPYLVDIKQCSNKIEDFPKTIYPDIVNYLLYTKSAYTHEDFKAYKGLDAYKQATCGWVKSIHVNKMYENFLILGRVSYYS